MSKLKVKSADSFKIDNKRDEEQINNLFNKISQKAMEIYVLFYICIFPLCIRDKYFDILSFRFELFWKPTIAYGVLFIVLGFLYLISDSLYNKGAIRKKAFKEMKKSYEEYGLEGKGKKQEDCLKRLKKCCKKFRIKGTDITITALVIIFSLSTILAEYPYEAFWGNRGRNQGLFLWLMFFIAYWLITRFYKFKKWHMWAFMTAASVVCIWGICNFFLLTFGMLENVDEKYKYMFVSSIGNINTYTSFTGIFYGVSVAMFIKSKDIISSVAAFSGVLVASFAQIMGMSDNAILSTGIVLVVAPLALCEKFEDLKRYFTAVFIYLGSMKVISLITSSGIKTMNDLDPSIQIKIAEKGFFTLGLFIFAGIIISAVFAKKVEKLSLTKVVGRFKHAWCVIIAVILVLIVLVLILANIGWHKEIWFPYSNILIFNDSWGTGRGLCWRLGMEFWNKDATFLMKLFGYGPDTFYIITMDRFMNIMQDAGYGMFDSAHNEYFEYFLTVGIIGLTSYLAFLYTSIRDMISSMNLYSKAIAMGTIAYACQAVVNIAIPITSVVFMLLLFVGISVNIKTK